LFLIHLSIGLAVLFHYLFFQGLELMAVGDSEELQLLSEQLVIVLNFKDIFSDVLDELHVVDFHKALDDIVEDFSCGYRLKFAFQVLFNTLTLQLSKFLPDFL
jgi:hypothetical protein